MPKKHDSQLCKKCMGFGYTLGTIKHRPECPFYVEEVEAKEIKPKIVADQNGDGEISEVEAKELKLKAKCDELGIKYKGTWGVKKLTEALDSFEAKED